MIAATQYQNVMDGWIQAQRYAGYNVSFERRMTIGFPLLVTLRYDNLQWHNNDAIDFHADHLYVSAHPWQWNKFHTRFKGHVELSAPSEDNATSLILNSEKGQAFIELTLDGNWTISELDLDAATIGRKPDYLLKADHLEALIERPANQPTSRSEVGLTVTGVADDITIPDDMPTVFGRTVQHAELSLRVMGAVPDFRHQASLAAWNKAGGVIESNVIAMDWGQLHITGKGSIGFDDDLQPEGAFNTVLRDYPTPLKIMSDAGLIAERQKALFDSAIGMFTMPDEKDTLHVPITIQLGGLFFGPMKIFDIPEIEWE